VVASGYRDGTIVSDYVFVGKLQDKIITGTWFDNEDKKLGYHGAFQMILSPDRKSASGKWIGYSANNVVKQGDLDIVMA